MLAKCVRNMSEEPDEESRSKEKIFLDLTSKSQQMDAVKEFADALYRCWDLGEHSGDRGKEEIPKWLLRKDGTPAFPFLGALLVRVNVFVTEQGCDLYDEFDDEDHRSYHLYGSETLPASGPTENQVSICYPVSSVRAVKPPHHPHPFPESNYPKRIGDTEPSFQEEGFKTEMHDGDEVYVKIGRLAVVKQFRGKGHSAEIVMKILQTLRDERHSIYDVRSYPMPPDGNEALLNDGAIGNHNTADEFAHVGLLDGKDINYPPQKSLDSPRLEVQKTVNFTKHNKDSKGTIGARDKSADDIVHPHNLPEIETKARHQWIWYGLVLAYAQSSAIPFWKKMGFEVDPELGEWNEYGIPHVAMWKRITMPKEWPDCLHNSIVKPSEIVEAKAKTMPVP